MSMEAQTSQSARCSRSLVAYGGDAISGQCHRFVTPLLQACDPPGFGDSTRPARASRDTRSRRSAVSAVSARFPWHDFVNEARRTSGDNRAENRNCVSRATRDIGRRLCRTAATMPRCCESPSGFIKSFDEISHGCTGGRCLERVGETSLFLVVLIRLELVVTVNGADGILWEKTGRLLLNAPGAMSESLYFAGPYSAPFEITSPDYTWLKQHL